MAEYDPLSAFTLTPHASEGGRRERLTPGLTLAGLAAQELGRAGDFGLIARANGVIDPVPWPGMIPFHLAEQSVSAGQELVIPDDLL